MNVEGIIIAVLALAAVGYLFAYIMKRRHYKVIDELEQKKRDVTQRSLNEQFQRADQLTLSGRSEEEYKELVQQWHEVETQRFPSIENFLFEAEKATDLLRFSKAKEAEEKTYQALSTVTDNIEQINQDLKRLLHHQAENQKQANEIQKQYQQLRKKLLTQSFTFGPALEELETRLSEMEEKFSLFSEYSAAGDHVEANKKLEQLETDIQEMEQQLEEIPEQLEMLNDVFPEDLEELKNGYEELRSQGIKFSDDTIVEDIRHLEDRRIKTQELVRFLELEKAGDAIEQMDDQISVLYDKMEKEVQAKQTVRKQAASLRKAFYYLSSQNRKLRIETDRISQMYVLSDEEGTAGERLKAELEEYQKKFEQLQDKINDHPLVFSMVQQQFEDLFKELERINEEQESTYENLLHLRTEEMNIKDHVDDMEIRMRSVKRKVEMHHLPGLPDQYLELFFYVTDRIEELAVELSQLKMDINKAREMEQLCEEEVQKIERQTTELLQTVQLTERVMPRISRHRADHPEVEEAIQKSRMYFREEFDYEAALQTLVAELEKIEPGVYEKIEARYLEETNTP